MFPESLVFVLGCQRSGTTWLANIFDASPETLLFMEPFSPPFGIFPEFPEASYHFNNSSPFLDHLLQVEMPVRLLHHKKLLFRRSMTDPRWFRLERWLAGVATMKPRPVPIRWQSHARKFRLLNLNRMDRTARILPKRTSAPVWIIKELRLAGKIPVLLSAFPNAHFVVIIRHPCATVHSILNWFGRGHLGELRRDLDTYLEKIETQTVSNAYKELITHCHEGTLAHKVALYWRISYETACKQLEHHPCAHFVVYEQLASQPRQTIESLFTKVGIPWSQPLDDYIIYSSKIDVAEPTPITTVRDSASHSRRWIDEISEEVRQAALDIAGDSLLMPEFEPHYSS